jgi:hypothetical protein
VSTDFTEEITRNRKFLQWLQRGEKFKGAVIPYLAHTCRALKNLAIFRWLKIVAMSSTNEQRYAVHFLGCRIGRSTYSLVQTIPLSARHSDI